MSSVRVIPADVRFADSFWQSLDAVARERRHLALTEAPPIDAVRDFVAAIPSLGGVQFFAVDPSDRVVAWCDILPRGQEGFRHCGQFGMGVVKAARGRGMGTEIARAAIAAAWQRGLERVELEVFASNAPAVRLYSNLGFVTEGVKRGARKLDGIHDDILIMALTRDSLAPG